MVNQMMLDALKLMGVGMLGVFIVLAVFYLSVKLLKRLFRPQPEEK